MSEFLRDINALNFADQYFCRFGNFNARKSSDGVSLLADYLCVKCAVDKNCLSDLLGLGGIEEITASVCKFLSDSRINIFMNDN